LQFALSQLGTPKIPKGFNLAELDRVESHPALKQIEDHAPFYFPPAESVFHLRIDKSR
jgi:hypothetical protein